MPRPPAQRDPDEWYPVMLCIGCKHPGGQHVLGGGCKLCPNCPGWGEQQGAHGYWNDQMTFDLLAATSKSEGATDA
jgi:hypothetical protein